jgi:hypothetical protein
MYMCIIYACMYMHVPSRIICVGGTGVKKWVPPTQHVEGNRLLCFRAYLVDMCTWGTWRTKWPGFLLAGCQWAYADSEYYCILPGLVHSTCICIPSSVIERSQWPLLPSYCITRAIYSVHVIVLQDCIYIRIRL